MSWLTKAFSTIGRGLVTVAKVVTSPEATQIETAIPLVGTFLSLINPKLAAAIKVVDKIVNGVEGLITTAQSGVAKKQTAIQIALAEIPGVQELVGDFGSNAKIPQAELEALIDATATLYNAGHEFVTALEAANPKSK